MQDIYEVEFTMNYRIKCEYRNKGLYPTTLHNVILMEFEGLA